MSQYNFFHNDWLDCYSLFDDYGDQKLYVNLDINFFNNLKFDKNSLKNYMKEAAILCSKELGNKPALCLSGGADSQAMLNCFQEANIICDVIVFKYKNNLNYHDIKTAYDYAEKNNIKIKEIELDIISFLSRENHDYAIKYKSVSPQFNVHYKCFNMLKDMGYTGVACGGDAPLQIQNNVWGTNYQRNTLGYIKYTEKSNFMCIGSFLSFYPQLAWSIGLLTEFFNLDKEIEKDYIKRRNAKKNRYDIKIKGYKNFGFDIIKQDTKLHGFEAIEKLLWDQTGDGLAFDKAYRRPIEKIITKRIINPGKSSLIFKEGVAEKIKSIYINNIGSCI